METPKENAPAPATTAASDFPRGLHYAYIFAIFNALSFQVVLNSPMVLYARSLGATATVLGIVVGMWPLLVIFQIPAAQYVNRVGFKRFVYRGWGTRVCFIFGMALVPLLGVFLDMTTQLVLLMLLLFGFNLSRGISSAGWLPWIASLVPEHVRGRYLARDAACVNIASFATFILAAGCLGGRPEPWRFAVLFGFSAVMGAISLSFLKRIPDVKPPEEPECKSGQGVPWGAMVQFPPFKKLLMVVVSWSVAYGGMTAFTVAFMKTGMGLGENTILLLNSVFYIGGLSSLWLLGSRLDHLGSKPVLMFSFAMWAAVSLGWGAMAGHTLKASMWLILLLHAAMGLCAALVGMSHVRLAMAIVPAMGRNHFFALYSVIGSLALGVAPIAWGMMIDAIGLREWGGARFDWNRYSIFFGAVGAVFVVTLLLARRLDEPKAVSMDRLLRELFVQTPQRAWARFSPRE